MSKRKPPTSENARNPKTTTKAQRAAQAVVRSPRSSDLMSAAADSTGSGPVDQTHNHSNHEVPLEANPSVVLVDDREQRMKDSNSRKGFYFPSIMANVQAYQTKLLEMAQANIQFALEFAQRLATIRSPVEFVSVNAEFASKRITLFGEHLKEIAEISAKR
jgi:Phasin protein